MQVLAISNPISVGKYLCDTAILKYKDEANAYGYEYEAYPLFFQQIRLGINIRDFKFPKKQSIYTQSNARVRKNNVAIYKTRDLYTEPMDELTLENLQVAINHSDVFIDNVEYNSQGDLEIEPTEVLGNLANGKTTLHLQEYQHTNVSCK